MGLYKIAGILMNDILGTVTEIENSVTQAV